MLGMGVEQRNPPPPAPRILPPMAPCFRARSYHSSMSSIADRRRPGSSSAASFRGAFRRNCPGRWRTARRAWPAPSATSCARLLRAAALLAVFAFCCFQDRIGRAGDARVEQQQPALKFRLGFRLADDRIDEHAAVGVEADALEAAIGGDVLVLLADRLAADVDLDAAGLLRPAAPPRRAGLGRRAGRSAGPRCSCSTIPCPCPPKGCRRSR